MTQDKIRELKSLLLTSTLHGELFNIGVESVGKFAGEIYLASKVKDSTVMNTMSPQDAKLFIELRNNAVDLIFDADSEITLRELLQDIFNGLDKVGDANDAHNCCNIMKKELAKLDFIKTRGNADEKL